MPSLSEEVIPTADKTVTARLRLVYNEFTKGTDAAAKGLRGIGDQAKKTSGSVGRDWQAIGKSVSGLGDRLTTRVSLPLVGLGVLASKAAGDFDAAFVRMTTLAGVSADEVDGMKEAVLGLAGETGKAPQELAEAMFFLQSSGLDAAGAMEALEISAKASAAGLGDTVTLADAASSVMLAYAESGMTAAQALDTLLATAKAGKAEPEAIAGQLSKLIPVASALEISFEDVGGALAALSTKGFSAEQGATALAAVMAKIQKPSRQAQEQLDAVGLSGGRLREVLSEKGLLGTLTMLRERLGDVGFERFLEEQEAIRGGVALMTGDMEGTVDIFDEVADSAGATEKAFATWAESMGAKNARAFADFQVALIKLGEVIAPIAADLMSFAADVIGGFAKLPDPVQKLVIAFAALMAAVGPLMSVGGRLISVWSSAMKLFDNFTSSGGRAFADAMNAGTEATNNLGNKMGGLKAAAGMAAGAAGIGAVLFAIDEMGRAAHEAEIEKLTEDFMEGADMADLFADALDGDVFTMSKVDEILGDLIDTNLEAAERFVDAAEAAGMEEERIEAARKAIEDKRTADAQAASDAEANQEAIEGTTEALADQEEQVNEAAQAFRDYADTIKGILDPVFGLQDALRGNQEAQRGVIEAQAKLDEVMADSESTLADVAAAQRDVEDAMLGVESSALDVTTAAADLNAAVAENPGLVDDALGALQTWRDQGIIPTDEQLRFLQDQIRETALQGVALGDVDPSVDVTESGSRRTRSELRTVRDAATGIPPSRNTNVSTRGVNESTGAIGRLVDNLNRLHDRTVRVNVVVNDPSGAKLGALSGSRARGGPVYGNRLYEVAENSKHEMFESQGHRYLLPGADGRVIPMGQMTSAAEFGGGAGTVVNLDMRGAVISSERQFRDMVKRAFNTGNRKGRGFNAA